jgi:hypothetical protein
VSPSPRTHGHQAHVSPARPAASDDGPGAEELPGWLLGVIVSIVALYTEPGQRVLLLAAPRDVGEAALSGAPGDESGSGLPAGLLDAAQTAARLGRTVYARFAECVVGTVPADSDCPTGRRPGPRHPSRSADSAAVTADPPRDRDLTESEPNCFHAVIAFVDPHQPDWVTGIAWSDLLIPGGALAFLTHGDHRPGKLIEPGSLLARTARRSGMAFFGHMLMLDMPELAGPWPSARGAHLDVLVYRAPSGAAAAALPDPHPDRGRPRRRAYPAAREGAVAA